MKNSGNFQSFEHKNFIFFLKKASEIKAQRCPPSIKIMLHALCLLVVLLISQGPGFMIILFSNIFYSL